MDDAGERLPSDDRGPLQGKAKWDELSTRLGTLLALIGVAISLQQNCQQSDEIALLRESNRPHVRLDLEQNTEGRKLVISARNVGNIPAVPVPDVSVIVKTAAREYSFNGLEDGGVLDPGDRNLLLPLEPPQELYERVADSVPPATVRTCLVYRTYSAEDDRRWIAYYEARWSPSLNQFQRHQAWELSGELGATGNLRVQPPSD